MEGITKRLVQSIALIAIFGLASCTTQPVTDNGDTGGGTSTGGTPTTGGGSGGGSTGGSGGGSAVTVTYVVQLIATNSSPKAEAIKNEFAGEGYPAVVSAIESGGSTLYRVQVGAYGTQADAQRVLNQMRRRYQRNQHVNNAVVKTKNGI